MIPVEDALRIAEVGFPKGPEALVAALGVIVEEAPLVGAEGWCMSLPGRALITINSSATEQRRRFTLAHELAHLLLGIPSVFGERASYIAASDNAEEQRVNALASQMLLPERHVVGLVGEIPISSTAILRLAKRANVSITVAALRIEALAVKMGMRGAAVIQYQSGVLQWQYSSTMSLVRRSLEGLPERCRRALPDLYRSKDEGGNVGVAALVENPKFETEMVLYQTVAADIGARLSRDEQVRHLGRKLFDGLPGFESSLNGCLGHFKNHIGEMPLDEAHEAFFKKYSERWGGEARRRFLGPIGRQFVRLKLSVWCGE